MFVFEWNGVTLKTNQRLMRNQWLIASLVFYFKERWHVISQTTLNWSHIFVRFQNINVPKTKIYHEKWNFTNALMFTSTVRLWLSCAHILWLNILNSKHSSFTLTWWLISKSSALYNIMIFPIFPRAESSEVGEIMKMYRWGAFAWDVDSGVRLGVEVWIFSALIARPYAGWTWFYGGLVRFHARELSLLCPASKELLGLQTSHEHDLTVHGLLQYFHSGLNAWPRKMFAYQVLLKHFVYMTHSPLSSSPLT